MRESPAVAALREIADQLRQLGTLHAAPSERTLASWSVLAVEALAAEESRWLTEDRAVRRSRHQERWFRLRFEGWERRGLSRWMNGRREYHDSVVPTRSLDGDLEMVA